MNLLPSPISTGINKISTDEIPQFIRNNFEWSTEGKFIRKKLVDEPEPPVLVLIDYLSLIR